MRDRDPATLTWRKSTRSGGNNNCVESAGLPGGGAAVRDSKDPEGPVLFFGAIDWAAFVGGVKSGEFSATA